MYHCIIVIEKYLQILQNAIPFQLAHSKGANFFQLPCTWDVHSKQLFVSSMSNPTHISSNIGKHFSSKEITSNKFEIILESAGEPKLAASRSRQLFHWREVFHTYIYIYVYTAYILPAIDACNKNYMGSGGDHPSDQILLSHQPENT